jgi:long-subunit acyl-CoA synthetase (AMP-forming)
MTFSGRRPATVCEAFQRAAAVDPCAVALRSFARAQTMTWREYAIQVRRVTAGLAAFGVRRGDAVALMMANRIEFYPLDVGAQHLGATPFSLYHNLPAEQLAHQLGKAGAVVLICEEQYVEKIKGAGAAVERIVCVDGAPAGSEPLAEMLAGGDPDFDFEATWRAVQPHDVATLIYTSGTTGDPKCVEITHANLLFEAFALDTVLGIRFGDRTTSFLPSAHVADRMSALYAQEVFGVQVSVVSDPSDITSALPEVRPTIWAAVSPVWEKMKATIENSAANEPDDAKREDLQWALSVADRRAAALASGRVVSRDVAAEWAKADESVLSELRTELGLDRLRWAVSGDAPVPKETLGFFAGLGIPITEVWGMSELTCIGSVSPPHDARLGSVGKLLTGLEGRIADDGEFLVRGPLVMKGYRDEPAATAAAIDNDGWLHTGDILQRDADGYLRVVDRKTDLIVNAAGKTMSPAHIETTVKAACPLIGAVIVIGDGRPYNTALIVPHGPPHRPYVAGRTLPSAVADAAVDPALIAQIGAGVAEGNRKLTPAEQVKRFRVLPTYWPPGGDELTLTFKLKRRSITEKYAVEIGQLYAPDVAAPLYDSAALYRPT